MLPADVAGRISALNVQRKLGILTAEDFIELSTALQAGGAANSASLCGRNEEKTAQCTDRDCSAEPTSPDVDMVIWTPTEAAKDASEAAEAGNDANEAAEAGNDANEAAKAARDANEAAEAETPAVQKATDAWALLKSKLKQPDTADICKKRKIKTLPPVGQKKSRKAPGTRTNSDYIELSLQLQFNNRTR